MEPAHFVLVRIPGMVHVQLTVESAGGDERMSHGYPFWLHRMVFRIGEFPERRIIEIRDSTVCRVRLASVRSTARCFWFKAHHLYVEN